VENLNKRVQKKLAKLLCQRPTEERAKLWPYILPLVAQEINYTWHHTIQDVPFRVLKGRHTAEFRYPDDEDFFEEVPSVDEGEFGEDDAFSFSEACPLQYSDEEKDDDENRTFKDVSVEPVFSFAERLEIGCSLARIREETRLQALEATERMIANNTRHRFRVSEERIARFSVGEVVLFKDPENVPAKAKKNAKDPFQARNVLGVVKERRALNFYRVQWEKNGKQKVSTLYAGMLYKYLKENKAREEKNWPTSSISHRDVADEVASFAYTFRLTQKPKRQKKAQVLEEIEKEMKELWLALDFGVAACILSGEKADDDVVARYQGQYERGISSLAERNFKFFLIGSVLWEKERTRCPNQILEVLENNGTIVTNLHEGECANCLAADACNHPCCHDWFFDIGHRMGLLYEEDKIGDNSVEKNGKQTRSESIFHFSQTDQIDDACDPLSYEGKSTGNIIYVFIYLFPSIVEPPGIH